MRIFLDVGAWKGETAMAVLSSNHLFDRVYCFEPQIDKCDLIKSKRIDGIEVCNFGLYNKTCIQKIYMTRHSGSASVYVDKFTKHPEGLSASDVKMVKASDWFKENIKQDDYVVLKINCEGSECDILDDLMDTGEFKKVSVLMVDFDVRKIPTQAHREYVTKKRLENYDISMITVEGEDRTRWSKKHEEWTHYWMDKIIPKK